MKVLFVASGNHKGLSPVIQSQGTALEKAGIELSYFFIKGKGLRGYLRQILPLREFCKENSFDVIHAHYFYSACIASLARLKPIVVSLMGSDVSASKVNVFFICLFSWLFQWQQIIVKSRSMAEKLKFGKKVAIIPNGVDLDLFIPMNQNECRNRLGWSNKSKHILFPANPERPEKDFYLAKTAVELIGTSIGFHVFRNVEHEATVLYYNAADVVLLTSKWEGSPNVIKEALACGCPIVSVNVGDVKERIEGIEGCFIAQSRLPEELAELLVKAIKFNRKTRGRDAIISSGLSRDMVSRKLWNVYENASSK